MESIEQFAQRIKHDPNDLEAWESILELVDDPKKKRDCQEQIDRITAGQQSPIICPQCGAGMNVYFAGELHDKRAKCPFCGAEIDIPDSYSKVVIEKRAGTGQVLPETEAVVYERRFDNNGASIDVEEINQLVMEKGLAAARQELKSRSIKGLQIDDIQGVEKSSEAYKIIEEKGLRALEKSQGVIFVTPKQVNQAIKIALILSIVLTVVAITYFLIQIFSLR
jgi:hypothetical protein